MDKVLAALAAGDVTALLDFHRGLYGSARMEDDGESPAEEEAPAEEAEEAPAEEEKFDRSYVQKLRDENAAWRKKLREAEQEKAKGASAEERAAAAEQRAAELEAKILRSDIAIEFGLSKDDAELLVGSDEEQMRKLAKRLGSRSADQDGDAPGRSKRPVGVRASANGNREKASGSSREALGRSLFGV